MLGSLNVPSAASRAAQSLGAVGDGYVQVTEFSEVSAFGSDVLSGATLASLRKCSVPSRPARSLVLPKPGSGAVGTSARVHLRTKVSTGSGLRSSRMENGIHLGLLAINVERASGLDACKRTVSLRS